MSYRFQAEVSSASGASLGDVPLAPDWAALRELCHFQGVREGRRLYFANAGPARIEPVWHATAGPPFVEKLRIRMTDADGEEFGCAVPSRFVQPDVEQAAGELVTSGALAVGEEFGFRLCAFPDSGTSTATRAGDYADDELDGEAVAVRLDLHPASLADAAASSERRHAEHWSDDDVPVFIPARIIEELQSAACADSEVESGAILIGRLCTDTDVQSSRPVVFVEISAQIPAEHTIATRTSLTFTGETWAAINGVIRLRGNNEITVSWAHGHPHFCRDCDAASRAVCPLSRPMFSAADINVHRTVFSQAYQVAVLLSFLGEEKPHVNVFGWRDGQVVPRGFYVR